MSVLCPNCRQPLATSLMQAEAQVKCPGCGVVLQLSVQARLEGPGLGALTSRRARSGAGWLTYVGVAGVAVVALLVRLLYLGQIERVLLERALRPLPPGAVEVARWHTASALPGEGNGALTLSPGHVQAGKAFVVVELDCSSDALETRPLTSAERESLGGGAGARAPDGTMAFDFDKRAYRLVGPKHALRPAMGGRPGTNEFTLRPTWSGLASKQGKHRLALLFLADRELAERGELSLVYKWWRPIPLVARASGAKPPT